MDNRKAVEARGIELVNLDKDTKDDRRSGLLFNRHDEIEKLKANKLYYFEQTARFSEITYEGARADPHRGTWRYWYRDTDKGPLIMGRSTSEDQVVVDFLKQLGLEK